MIDLLKWAGALVAASFAGIAIAGLLQLFGSGAGTANWFGGYFSACLLFGIANEVPFRGRPS